MPPPPQLELDAHAVGQGVLRSLHYLPEFLSPAEEARLLEQVHASKAKWVQVCATTTPCAAGSPRSRLTPPSLAPHPFTPAHSCRGGACKTRAAW